MVIVVRYARRSAHDDREYLRRHTVKLERSIAALGWHEAIDTATAGLREGERIVSIAEAGYN